LKEVSEEDLKNILKEIKKQNNITNKKYE